VGMTTTSLYGSFSMYNSLKWWRPVGSSKGDVPLKPSNEVFRQRVEWLKEHRTIEHQEIYGTNLVTNQKGKVLDLICRTLEIKRDDYIHNFQRGVYYSCFYENTKEFLRGEIAENELRMKPLFCGDVDTVLNWWKPKAIQRYKQVKKESRLNPSKLFYSDLKGMDYEAAKKKYLDDVGK
jgi:uncharacterized protein DUF4338